MIVKLFYLNGVFTCSILEYDRYGGVIQPKQCVSTRAIETRVKETMVALSYLGVSDGILVGNILGCP